MNMINIAVPGNAVEEFEAWLRANHPGAWAVVDTVSRGRYKVHASPWANPEARRRAEELLEEFRRQRKKK